MRRVIGIIGLLLLSACGADEQGTIYLGIAGPLEMSSGRSLRHAAEMAIAEINESGGINGRRIELIAKDDGADPERAIEVAAELRDDPRVVAVIGHINSAATLEAAGVYNDDERGVLQITPASSSPRVSEAGPWTFRVCPSDLQHGPALATWAFDRLDRRRAAVLYANDDYGRGLLDSFGSAFLRAGGEVIAGDPFLPALMESGNALDPYIERAIRREIDVLVIAGQAEQALQIVQAARRLGYDGPVLGADGITNLKDQGEIAEGVYVTSAFLPDRPTPAAQQFVQRYQEQFGELPDHRGAMAYDAIHLVARGLREVGPDRHALRDYMETVGNDAPSFEGVSGTISFDAKGDVAGKDVAVGIIRAGQIVTAS